MFYCKKEHRLLPVFFFSLSNEQYWCKDKLFNKP